jgi:hypothetical protein
MDARTLLWSERSGASSMQQLGILVEQIAPEIISSPRRKRAGYPFLPFDARGKAIEAISQV